MPEDYDRSKTHSVAMYLTRDMREFIDDKVYYANLVEDFRPDGEAVTESWNAMSNETCNSCHDPLALHGGRRQDVKLCVTCHSPQSLDPDTGNTVDMKVMIHKIHMGAELPSVQAGIPYQIIGFRNSVHDYSHAVFPQSNLNCTTCHPADSPEGDIWYTRPTRASCGSCHDNINWVTGEGHRPGPAENDDTCARCHTPEGESEFDISIIGAHTQPANSTQLAGFNAEILELSNTGPGEHPTVTYRLTNDAGETIEPGSLPFLNAVLAGPTEDYVTRISERIVEASAQDGDAYSYTFNEMVPNDAEGESYAVALEGFRMVPIDVREDEPLIFRETSNNPVEYFKAGGGEPDLRRMSVTDASCNNCHKDLNFHGTIRQGIEYCVTCHNPTADDSPVRPDEALPARSIDFKFLIHRIHRGQDLDRPYTVYGFGSRPHTYNSVVYPGDLRNCEACHESGSYGLPTPGVEPTFDANEFFSPMLTGSTVCLSCHDTQSAAAHAFVNTAPFGESCASCHGENREFSVTKVHAR